MNFRYLLLVFLIGISCDSKDSGSIIDQKEVGEFIDDWTFEVFMDPESSSSKAVFRLWIPEGITPKNILVLAPGGFGNGIGLVNHKEWQDYAKKEGLALLGVYVTSTSSASVNALFTGLKNISIKREVGYVNDLPFLLRGFSSGGRFAYTFSSKYPHKTVAFANIKGLIPNSDQISKSISELIIVGEMESIERIEHLKSVFSSSRRDNKICCFAIEPNEGHSLGDSDQLVRDFFSSVLKERLILGGSYSEENLFLGNIETFEYSVFSDYQNDKEKASCLIDKNFAVKWADFMAKE